MFELCVRWLAWGLDTSLKAVLVALVAAALLRLLRLRDSNIRHRIWTGVLSGMLALPLLTPLMPALRLPLMPSPEWLVAWTAEPASPEATTQFPSTEPLPVRSPSASRSVNPDHLSPIPSFEPNSDSRWASPPQLFPTRETTSVSEIPTNDRVWPTEHLAESPPPMPLPPPPGPRLGPSLRTVVATLVLIASSVWLLVCALLCLRLSVGLWMAARLRYMSIGIDCADLPPTFSVAPIRECAGICVPLTVGTFAPQILLPADWRRWPAEKLLAVIAHEQMHVQRADCVVALIAEINCCLYWFHPLAWWLKQQLAALAEQACDDAAINSIGNRTQYARHLLEVAAAVSKERGRLVPASVSMARRTSVETRIRAILDFTRPLSKRLSWTSTLLLLGMMVPLIVLAAALQPLSNTNTDSQPESTITTSEDSNDADKPVEDITFTFAGSVVDDRGQPVSAAEILLGDWSDVPLRHSPLRLAISDGHGKFQFSRTSAELAGTTDSRGWFSANLIAMKADHGFALGPVTRFETSGRLTAELNDEQRERAQRDAAENSRVLTLVPDAPLRGRILNTDGQPVSGAKIEVLSVWVAKGGLLDAWLAAAKEKDADYYSARRHLNHLASGRFSSGPRPVVIPPVRTDDDGWFTISGLGRERMAEIFVSGPGIETSMLHVRTRAGDVVSLPSEQRNAHELVRFYPGEFTHVAGPSHPVTGRVTDKATGQPIAGSVVQANKIATHYVHGSFNATYIRAITDADGRYRLEGLPLGSNSVLVLPPRGSRYLASAFGVDAAAQSNPLVRDVALSLGVMVRGRVTDGRTGQPLSGNVEYHAFDNNPHLESAAGFGRASLPSYYHRSDENGNYQIPVLPGGGMLTFMADKHADYPRGAGADRIDGPKSVTNAVFFLTQPYRVLADNFHLLAPLNPHADATEVNLDLTLPSGLTLTGRIRTPDGQSLGEYFLYGERAFAGWNIKRTGETFQVKSYIPAEGRRVMVYHPAGNLVGIKDITGDPPADLEIVLQPGAKFVGRVIDADGMPLEDLFIGSDWGRFNSGARYSPDVAKSWGDMPTQLEGRLTRTDKNGRFEITGIISGLEYSAAATANQRRDGQTLMRSLGSVFKDITAEPGQTKDLGDLRIKPRRTDDDKQEPKADQANAAAPADDAFTYAGSVVDPSGKPVAGAKLHLCYFTREPAPDLSPVAVTDASGQFRFSRRRQDFDQRAENGAAWRAASLVATADGFGFGRGASPIFETTGRLEAELPAEWRKRYEEHVGPQTNVIKLVPDAPVKSRIVNIDGQPVAGAKLTVNYIWGSRDANLDDWEKGANQPKASAFELQRSLDTLVNGPRAAAVVQASSSDSDGWLTIKGLGKDRLAKVQLIGPGIESSFFHVRSRPGETLKISIEPQRPGSEQQIYYPATFSHVAGPTQPVIGQVTDANSGKPIPRCVVQGTLHGGTTNGTMVYRTGEIQTLTDADGRYRLEGLERVTRNPLAINNLLVLPPRGSNYLAAASAVSIGASSDPVKHDVSLHRGIRVRGQAIDSRTGKPVLGSLRYSAFSDNPAAQAAANFAQALLDHYYYQTDATGRFEIPVLPGKGVLSFSANNWPDYPQGIGLDKVQAASPSAGRDVAIRMFNSANLLTPIDLAGDLKETTIDLTLSSSQTITGRVLSPEGQVLKNYAVYGGPISWFWNKIQGETFEVKNYDEKEGRRLLINEPDRNLVGLHQLTGKAPAQFDIQLSPGAVIKGRIVDADGLPLENINITNEGKPVTSPLMMQQPQPEEPGRGVLPHYLDQRRFSTDKEGRFELHGIIPGLKYTADCQGEGKIGGRTVPMGLGRLFTDITAEPGQTKDLGDLRPAPRLPPPPKADNAKKSAATISGRAVDNADRPIANAHVAVIGWPTEPQQGVKNAPRAEIIADGKTDDTGRFHWPLPSVSSNSHQPLFLIARGAETAVAWKKLNGGALPNQISLTLQPEVPVRVRLIDIEGQPAAGVRLEVGTVMKRANGELSDDGVGFGGDSVHPAWIAPLVADQDGRFTIHGLAHDHGIWLSLEASDRFGPQGIALNTGLPEERPQRDATYRDIVRNVRPGEEVIVPLSPAQVIEGTIRYEDTGAPVPHALVSVWASQQRNGGSMSSVEGKTDDAGRYRVSAHPGIRFGVMAYAPTGAAYLIRRTTEDIRWENGDRVKQQDLTLPPGILIRGKVLAAGSGQPIANAAVQFIPQESAARPPQTGVVTGWQGIQNTLKDGSFQIAIPPGPGHLLVNHDMGSYVLQEIGSLVLNRGKPGGERNYAHAIEKIDPAPDAKSLDLTIELQPGAKVNGRIVDPQGQLVDDALVISRLHIWSHWLSWHGNGGRSGPALGGRFELKGLKQGVEYPTHFLDPKRRLGATVRLKAGDAEPTIVLQPSGSATVRFVDPAGQPLADHRPNFDFIVTPGAHRYDSESIRSGQLAADADFAANIDRANHGNLKTDAAGKLTIPALIPGATYALTTANKGRWQVAKEFQVHSGQTLDLGDIVVATAKE